MLKISLCFTLHVSASILSSPPYTWRLLNFLHNFVFPPAWSQWWWVVRTFVKVTLFCWTAQATVSGSTGSTIAASCDASSIIFKNYKIWYQINM